MTLKQATTSNCATNSYSPRQSTRMSLSWKMQLCTRNLYSFLSKDTHWVFHNHKIPILTDIQKDREIRANASSSSLAFQLNWEEWEIKAPANTQQESQDWPNSPYSMYRLAQITNKCEKTCVWPFFFDFFYFFDVRTPFWACHFLNCVCWRCRRCSKPLRTNKNKTKCRLEIETWRLRFFWCPWGVILKKLINFVKIGFGGEGF